MGFRDLDPVEIELVLEKERVIRIAFSANGEQFLVPVFNTWFEGALCGMTTPGRKTRPGEGNPASRSRSIAPPCKSAGTSQELGRVRPGGDVLAAIERRWWRLR